MLFNTNDSLKLKLLKITLVHTGPNVGAYAVQLDLNGIVEIGGKQKNVNHALCYKEYAVCSFCLCRF